MAQQATEPRDWPYYLLVDATTQSPEFPATGSFLLIVRLSGSGLSADSSWRGPRAMVLIHMSYPLGRCTPGPSVCQCKPSGLAEEAVAEQGPMSLFQLSLKAGREAGRRGLGRRAGLHGSVWLECRHYLDTGS